MLNGYCVQTNSCVCDPGWTGDRCRIGESSNMYTCKCKVSIFLKILMNAVMVFVINCAKTVKDHILVIVILDTTC